MVLGVGLLGIHRGTRGMTKGTGSCTGARGHAQGRRVTKSRGMHRGTGACVGVYTGPEEDSDIGIMIPGWWQGEAAIVYAGALGTRGWVRWCGTAGLDPLAAHVHWKVHAACGQVGGRVHGWAHRRMSAWTD